VEFIVNGAVSSASLDPHNIHLSIIPHLSPALGMSLLTIITGVFGFRYYGKIHDSVNSFLNRYPYLKANWWYDNGLEKLKHFSEKAAEFVHHGVIRRYFYTALAGFAVFGISGYVAASLSLPVFEINIAFPAILIASMGVIAAFKSISADSHVSGVLSISVLGAAVAIFYILARAPDLALTQLVVETLSLVIFMLVLDRLPSFYGEIRKSRKIIDAALSVLVGATVAVTVFLTTSANPGKISDYFVENAVEKGGGSNIVNVILVDFRGFDTMGEITVVAMAALAVVTLIGMRGRYPSFRSEESMKDAGKNLCQETLDKITGGDQE
jgi:multicomponent Na+:H+ antiporter subunit A